MIQRFVTRLKDSRGESLIEVMVAMMIITMAGMILAGAILSATHINANTAKMATFPSYSGLEAETKTASMNVTYKCGDTDETVPVDVRLFKVPGNLNDTTSEGKMYYYEKK
ncbi:MAG: hypothetical protein E7474_13015 [Ruminococcaceae bacterium]|nr:hypothetical protein [Oscillospiraceae bacterium]